MIPLSSMRSYVVPVVDLLEGVVVRGVAGRRNEYRRIESRLTERADALSVARAFRGQLGLERLYVADLHAIMTDRADLDVVRALADDGFHVIVDAGLRNIERAGDLLNAGAESLVAALETIPGPRLLSDLCATFGAERVVFSLDLQSGRPLGNLDGWNSPSALELAHEAIENGITRMIVLDLAQVGCENGLGTLDLCRKIRRSGAHVELLTGGGIRDLDDLNVTLSTGVDAVLVASALHNGVIGASELDQPVASSRRSKTSG